MAERRADVIVVGGGPAGSTLAWRLARDGARVVLLERARFPREKVCGDYVEPRGLAILAGMGCLETLETRSPLPITASSTYVEGVARYRGQIPFYGRDDRTPAHGYIVPRDDLDAVMLEAAEAAGAVVHQETGAGGVQRGSHGRRGRGSSQRANRAVSVGARRRCRRRQLGGRHRGRHPERRRASHRGRATGLRDGHGQRRRRGDVLVRSVALSRLRLGLSDGRRPGQHRHRHPGRDAAPPGHRHPGASSTRSSNDCGRPGRPTNASSFARRRSAASSRRTAEPARATSSGACSSATPAASWIR